MKLKTKTFIAVLSIAMLFLIYGFCPISNSENMSELGEKNAAACLEKNLCEKIYSDGLYFSLCSNNTSRTSYIIEARGDEYVAKVGDSEVSDPDLSSLIASVESDGVSIHFSSVSYSGTLTFEKSVTLSGDLTLSSGNLNLSGENTILDSVNITLSNGSVRVKGGTAHAVSGSVYSESSSAFLLDFISGAKLIVSGMDISAKTTRGALLCSMGSIEISGGKIENLYGPAVENTGSLSLSGAPDISGWNFDVVTDNPITLKIEDYSFDAELDVMYQRTFLKGSFTVVFHKANENSVEKLSLFDASGEKVDISYFSESVYTEEKNSLAVYLPYEAKFYNGNMLYTTEYFLSGEGPIAPAIPEKSGYTFDGWYRDTAFSESYTFGEEEYSDISLYASFKLTYPEFAISSLEFTYDGKAHLLSFEKLTHPLSESGNFSFVWYKNSDQISFSSESLSLTDVSDSGSYFCKLTFAYCGDFVTVTTPTVEVKIQKRAVEKPSIQPMEYTGETLYPVTAENELYTYSFAGAENVGIYPVTLTLSDPENYKWQDSDIEITSISFEILRAENKFLTYPKLEEIYEGEEITVSYSVRFGSAKYLFSRDAAEWSETAPDTVGNYYIKVTVHESENYTFLESEPIPFEILPEISVGIKIDKYPDKTVYYAFEELDLKGAEFTVTYNSGRSEKIDISALSVSYKNGECFLASDSSATVIFDESSVPLPVSVVLCDYDISSIVFGNETKTYDGKRHTITPVFDIVGLDGIRLEYKITGGGIDAGSYEVTLSFLSDSINYNIPDSITKTLIISPMVIPVEYTNTEFVYDGTPKIPTATIINAQGLPLTLSVAGAATDAGEYVATASLSDKNYTLENSTVSFKILKADLDFSSLSWSADSFVYSGQAHSVEARGLPAAVTLVGYANSAFTEVGEYVTEVTISYDTKNYNTPGRITHTWKITPADYDFSSFGFLDSEFVYDGNIHYPESFGSLPIGFDGSSPSYTFSRGATHVSEGKISVDIIFESGSKNYNTPEKKTVSVTVLPKGVSVVWNSLTFTYDGAMHLPTAECADCEIEVVGAAKDAGEYIAEARSKNSDYTIINSKIVFTVSKALNSWIDSPKIGISYEGKLPAPYAKALSGEPIYSYFEDEAMTRPINAPTEIGTYYVIAYVPESNNYLYLSSAPIEFSVLEILPVELRVEFPDALVAMSDVLSSGIKAYLINNDGSSTEILPSDITVEYENADFLTAGDTKISFRYGDFTREYGIRVEKSEVVLPSLEPMIYDGNTKILSALESHLYTTDYIGVKDAGIYKINLILTDSENYKFKDGIDYLELKILKAPLTLEVGKDGESYTVISGTVFGSDLLYEEYYTEDGMIYLKIANENYEATVIPRDDGRGAKYVWLVFLLALILVLLALSLYIVFNHRERVLVFAAGIRNKLSKKNGAEKKAEKTEIKKSSAKAKDENPEPPLETLLAVDELHANTLISDSLAKSLLSDSEDVIKTEGKKRYIVNLDTLSDNFSSGDRVDINKMKDRGVIPHDAKSVKVLARGVIDKPLHITANAFSLAAVKMIALTGGSAKRAHTSKLKEHKKESYD